MINTINPGVIVTWLAAVTATANTSDMYRFVLFSCCLGLILSVDFCKVFLADAIKRKLTLRRILYLHKISAACILVIGIILLITTAFNVQFKKRERDDATGMSQKQKKEFYISRT